MCCIIFNIYIYIILYYIYIYAIMVLHVCYTMYVLQIPQNFGTSVLKKTRTYQMSDGKQHMWSMCHQDSHSQWIYDSIPLNLKRS